MDARSDEKRIRTLLTPLNDDQRVEVTFTAYYDKPKKETAWRGFKTAAEEISYLKPKQAIEIACTQIDEFSTFIQRQCEKNANLTSLRDYVVQVAAALQPFRGQAELNLKALFTVLFEKGDDHAFIFYPLSEVVTLMDDLTKDKGVRFAFDRFVAAFRGLAMNAAIHATRARLLEKMLSQSSRLKQETPHPLMSRNIRITVGKKEVLTELSETEPSEVMPLMMAALQDMYGAVQDDASRHALFFVKFTMSKMRDLMDQAFPAQLATYKATADEVLTNLTEMTTRISRIQPNDAIKIVGLELSTYLCATFLHSFNHQALLFFKSEDAELKKETDGKLSKLGLAQHFENASLAVGALFKAQPTAFANVVRFDLAVFQPSAPQPASEAELARITLARGMDGKK